MREGIRERLLLEFLLESFEEGVEIHWLLENASESQLVIIGGEV